MDAESVKTVVVLTLGATVCLALHLAIGSGQRRLAERLGGVSRRGVGAAPSLRILMLEWLGHGLRTMAWMLYVALVLTVLPRTRAQFETVGGRMRRQALHFIDWLSDRGFNLVIVLVVTVFLMRFIDEFTRTVFILIKRTTGGDAAATQRRLETLASIFSRGAQSVILFIGLMVLLQQLNVNVTPILASAGVIGIAVGLGAQSLIRDLFSGLLILLEDQFSVGDTVKIGECAGTVEQVTLRATRLRGLDGALTTIPNGAISIVSNLSKEWSRVVLDLEVDHNEDVDRAMRVVLDAATQFRREAPHDIVEDPTLPGIEKISLSSVSIRITIKTAPARQFELARELRRRILIAFQENSIRLPLPVTQLVWPTGVTAESATNHRSPDTGESGDVGQGDERD